MEPRPASSTNLANVSYVHQHFLNLSDYYNYAVHYSNHEYYPTLLKFQAEDLKEKGGAEHGALVQQILETQQELEEPKKKTIGGVEIVISNFKTYLLQIK